MSQQDATLHLLRANPDAAQFRAWKLRRDQMLFDQDDLSIGPWTQDLSKWVSTRDRFHGSLVNHFSVSGLTEILNRSDEIRACPNIHVWAGSCLQDQLFLAWIVLFFTELDLPLDRVGVRRIDQHDSHVGVTSPNRVSSELTEVIPLNKLLRNEYYLAARRISEGDPPGIVRLIEKTTHDPLRNALFTLLTRFPDIDSGLDACDRALLETVLEPKMRLFPAIGHCLLRLFDYGLARLDLRFPMLDSELFSSWSLPR